jgi:hypothetical protein
MTGIPVPAGHLRAAVFRGTEMAFTLLMRLPERLEAERESDGDALGAYLEDPMRFFVPARIVSCNAARGPLRVVVSTVVDRTPNRARPCSRHGGFRTRPLACGAVLPAVSSVVSPEAHPPDRAADLHAGRQRGEHAVGVSSTVLGELETARGLAPVASGATTARRPARSPTPAARSADEAAPAIGRGFRRTLVASDDAAAGHRGDPIRRDDRGSPQGCRRTGILAAARCLRRISTTSLARRGQGI